MLLSNNDTCLFLFLVELESHGIGKGRIIVLIRLLTLVSFPESLVTSTESMHEGNVLF